MHETFTTALEKHNNSSLLIWVEYLKICNEVVSNNRQLFQKYELAESFIGLHFYSGEFWEMYLEQVQLRCKTYTRYLVILRKILELPIYSYSKFYALWLDAIDNIKDLKQLAAMVPEGDLSKKFKIDVKDPGRKGPRLQEGKKLLRKSTKELYMVVQYRVLEIYNLFEINLKTHYYMSAEALVEHNEIETWWKYLEYSITNGIDKVTQINFQRALLPLAHYELIWLKYSFWLIQSAGDYVSAKTVLVQGLKVSHKKAKILEKLSAVMLKMSRYPELVEIFEQTKKAYDEKIEESDDFELFQDYFCFVLFMERCFEAQPEATTGKIDTDPIKLLMKRLSYGEHKSGQEELLHMVCQSYQRFSRKMLEEKVFRPIIDQNWTFYLNSEKFWYEYCLRVWNDQESSYLEKRRHIVSNIIPEAAKQGPSALKGLLVFCETYLPEDLESCYKIGSCN